MDLNDNYSVNDFGSNYILEPLRPGPVKTMKTQGGVLRIWEFVDSGDLGIAPGLYIGVLAYLGENSIYILKTPPVHYGFEAKWSYFVKFGSGDSGDCFCECLGLANVYVYVGVLVVSVVIFYFA